MLKKILFSLFLSAGCLIASAQSGEVKETFNPHWYGIVQAGAQSDLGETSAGKLFSANFQLGVGYQFHSLFGARFTLSGFQSTAGTNQGDMDYSWKWNYITPELDATLDLTNLIGGYKKRIYSIGIFGGIGLNVAFNNGEAASVKQQMLADHAISNASLSSPGINYIIDKYMNLAYLWDGTTARVTGRFGATVDFHVTPRIDIGLEGSATTLRDTYNSRRAGNSDWYFNALVGVKYHFGKTVKKVSSEKSQQTGIDIAPNVEDAKPAPVVPAVDENKVEETPEVKEEESVKAEPFRRDIFYKISKVEVSAAEMHKVEEIAEYLKANASAKLLITGYADRGTGNKAINAKYAKMRAETLRNLLVSKFGIDESRIRVDSKGDEEQPFEKNESNRVCISIAE